MTSARMARGRFTLLGSVSFFMMRTKAKQKDTIINVRIEALLLIKRDSPHLSFGIEKRGEAVIRALPPILIIPEFSLKQNNLPLSRWI